MWRPTSAVEFRITTNNYQARIAEANHRNTQSRQSPFRGKKLKSRCNSADSTFRAKQNLFASTTDEVNVENKEKITKGGKVKSCNLIPKKEPQSKYQFPSWISVGQNVWIFHPSLISFHGWHPGMIKSVINGKSIVVNFFKNNDKLDYGLNHKTLHSIKINQHSIIKYNDGEIISNQETYLRKRSNFIVSIYWNSITQSLERHLEDETLNHLIQSCIIPKTYVIVYYYLYFCRNNTMYI